MKSFKIIILFLATWFCTNTFAYFAQQNLMTIGTYNKLSLQGKSTYPLLLLSKDQGLTWWFRDNLPPFANDNEAEFSHFYCNNQDCIVTGYFTTYQHGIRAAKQQPILFYSYDQGEHWRQQQDITDLPADIQQVNLFALHCEKEFCIAAGESYNKENEFQGKPLLLQSKDRGASWRYITHFGDTPIHTLLSGVIRSVHCNNQYCSAVGNYISKLATTKENRCLIAISQDYGQSWQIRNQQIADDLTLKGMDLQQIICSKDNHCLITGEFNMESTLKNSGLFILKSDGLEKPYQFTNIPYYFKRGSINQLNCENHLCMLVGKFYLANNTISNPLLLVSYNDGVSWSATSGDLENAERIYGELNSLTCNQERCVVVGREMIVNNQKQMKSIPLILESTDHHHFKQLLHIKDLPNIATNEQAGLSFVNCDKITCFSGGYFYTSMNEKTPLLLLSNVKNNWKMNHQISQLPWNRISLHLTKGVLAKFSPPSSH